MFQQMQALAQKQVTFSKDANKRVVNYLSREIYVNYMNIIINISIWRAFEVWA